MVNIVKISKVLERIKNENNSRRKCSYGDAHYGDYGDHSGNQDEDVYGGTSYGDYGDHSG